MHAMEEAATLLLSAKECQLMATRELERARQLLQAAGEQQYQLELANLRELKRVGHEVSYPQA